MKQIYNLIYYEKQKSFVLHILIWRYLVLCTLHVRTARSFTNLVEISKSTHFNHYICKFRKFVEGNLLKKLYEFAKGKIRSSFSTDLKISKTWPMLIHYYKLSTEDLFFKFFICNPLTFFMHPRSIVTSASVPLVPWGTSHSSPFLSLQLSARISLWYKWKQTSFSETLLTS